jgi:hypothetical protein
MKIPHKATFIGVREGKFAAVFVQEEKTTRSLLDFLPDDWDMRKGPLSWGDPLFPSAVTAYAILWAMTEDKAFCDAWALTYMAVEILTLPKAGFELDSEEVLRVIGVYRENDRNGDFPPLVCMDGAMSIR